MTKGRKALLSGPFFHRRDSVFLENLLILAEAVLETGKQFVAMELPHVTTTKGRNTFRPFAATWKFFRYFARFLPRFAAEVLDAVVSVAKQKWFAVFG